MEDLSRLCETLKLFVKKGCEVDIEANVQLI